MKWLKVCLLSTVVLCLLSGVSMATPWVVCDEYPTTGLQPDYFEVTFDGAVTNSTPQAMPGGGVRLHYDLNGITTGLHNMTVKACSNFWGCSAATPFGFTKSVPGAPGNLRLSNQ